MAELVETAALAAIAIGLGMLTAGAAAAAMPVVAGAGVVTGAGLGVAQTLGAIRQFQFEEAATNTDLHGKAKSISQEDPSLFWLAVDVVSTFVELKAAASEFRAIVRMSRAATAAKLAKNEEEARRLLDELREKGKTATGKQEAGDRLRREAEELGTSVAQDAGEIAANLDKVRLSTHPGYTHEIPLDGGRFWRRSPTGSWCVFASPPRCAVGVIDQLVTGAPWLSGISIDTFAGLMTNRNALKAARKDPRAGKLLEKYGVDAVKTMEHAAFHGEFPVELMVRYDRVSQIPGADQLLVDLAAGSSTTKGAIGELTYIEMLLERGEKIERIADVIDGQKAADIILKDKKRTILDMKYIDWTHWRWKLPKNVDEKAQELVRQVARRRTEYPGSPIVYVFAGDLKDVPAPIVKALKEAKVDVRGTI
jgi:hypothetical protein